MKNENTGAIVPPVVQAPMSDTQSFKNFHRLLCDRFDYCHDEQYWWRDQLSLIEHIAKRGLPNDAPIAWYFEYEDEDGTQRMYNGHNQFPGGSKGKPLYAAPIVATVPSEFNVRTILLDVVPGDDGMGQEVYAKNVDDVVQVLSQMGCQLEAYALGIAPSPTEQASDVRKMVRLPVPFIIDTTAPNQAYVSLGFDSVDDRKLFVELTRSGQFIAPADKGNAPAEASDSDKTDAKRYRFVRQFMKFDHTTGRTNPHQSEAEVIDEYVDSMIAEEIAAKDQA